MQRSLVKYVNEKESMAVQMKTQDDLELCSTWWITIWFFKEEDAMFMAFLSG